MIGSGLELVITGWGRDYELRRDGDVVGTVHRRGFFRRLYTAAIGDTRWRFDKPRSRRLSVVDETEGQEIARVEVVEDDYRLFVEDGSRQVEPAPFMRHEPGGRSFYDGAGGRLLTLRHLGGRKGTIAAIDPGDRPWPSPDPDAGSALAIAILAVRLIAERDASNEEEFSPPFP